MNKIFLSLRSYFSQKDLEKFMHIMESGGMVCTYSLKILRNFSWKIKDTKLIENDNYSIDNLNYCASPQI